MIDVKQINKLVEQVVDALPPGLKNLPKNAREELCRAMHKVFIKMDLVTREEFEVQEKVLQKTRQKLHKLEKQIVELEQKKKK